MKRRTKIYGLAVGIPAIVCFMLVYFLGIREEDTAQAYKPYIGYFTTTPTIRISAFESILSRLQQSGGGEVIFQGGEGFVRFRVREDGNIVALVPVSASVRRRLPATLARFFMADKYKFVNIRLPRHERQRLEKMDPLQNATVREVTYPGTAPHIFLESALGSGVARASVLAESILTEVFQIGSGMLDIYGGEYRKFRW